MEEYEMQQQSWYDKFNQRTQNHLNNVEQDVYNKIRGF